MQGSHHIKTMSVEEPTGKLKFAYTTIANMEAKIKSQQQELDKANSLKRLCKEIVEQDCLMSGDLKDMYNLIKRGE